MWSLSQVGAMELFSLLLVVALAACFGKRGLRWLMAVGPLMVISIVMSGPDPLSMLIVLAFLAFAFVLGVYWGPRLLSVERQHVSGDRRVA
jgi:hypothetical protein